MAAFVVCAATVKSVAMKEGKLALLVADVAVTGDDPTTFGPDKADWLQVIFYLCI